MFIGVIKDRFDAGLSVTDPKNVSIEDLRLEDVINKTPIRDNHGYDRGGITYRR